MAKMGQDANELIQTLEKNQFYAECPCGCNKTFLLRDAGLFYLNDFNDPAREEFGRRQTEVKERRLDVRKDRANMAQRLEKSFGPIQVGKITEKIAPFLPGFPHHHTDCRPLFDPIDFIVFEGAAKGSVSRIIFTEIKTGKARLQPKQKQIKELVGNKKVDFNTYKGGGK